ncbi:MAG TPA: hypothetical protein VK816_10785 [Jatrophihabitantaceae bacterium]|jgi:predicted HD phosphohydrolase|nr:hypothetical protein [Jatrophihabitantaceae bacterium]
MTAAGHDGPSGVGDQRTSFRSLSESTKDDWAIIMRGLESAQALVADNVLAQLRMLANEYGGFPVDRLEHSLQTATRAERDGRDDEYILCALLHDVGDNLAPLNHPSIAAGILKPLVSRENHWMIAHHGIFQGYYFWHHIGLDRDHREKFRDSPYFEHTEEFCAKYDSPAFDVDYHSEPLEHFEPIVRAWFAPRSMT